MPRRWRRVLWLLLVLPAVCAVVERAAGQGTEADASVLLAESLVERGFQHVAVAREEGRLVVSFENSRFRDEVYALKYVLEEASRLLPGCEAYTLIPRRRGVALVAVTVPADAYRRFVAEQDGAEAFRRAIEVETDPVPYRALLGEERNASSWRAEVVVHPQMVAEFGNFVDAVRSQVNIAPELSASLWKGMRLSGQLVVPLHDDLGEDGTYVRPGIVAANQTVRLPHGVVASATLGYYRGHQYGLRVEAEKYLWQGRLALGGAFGRTGYASFHQGVWFYDRLDETTYQVRARWHLLPRHAFSTQVAYGRYLFGNAGWRLEMSRAFEEVEVAFYATSTDAGANAGVALVLPLPTQTYMRSRRLRVRPASYFPWTYRYRRLDNVAMTYDTGNDLHAFRKYVHPGDVAARLAEQTGWRHAETRDSK